MSCPLLALIPEISLGQCLKYKTHSSIILNRFEALNMRLLTLMAAPTPGAPALDGQDEGDVSMVDVSLAVGEREETPAPETPSAAASKKSAAASGGGGVSKKKKKGKR